MRNTAMDEKDYITRFEVDERLKRVDDENNRQNHRIDKLETITDQIAEMAASIKAMVVTLERADGRTIMRECIGAFPDMTPEPTPEPEEVSEDA